MRFAPLLVFFACGGSEPIATGTPSGVASGTPTLAENTVVLSTAEGDITIELFPDEAPNTVANFLAYVASGFYDGDDGDGAGSFYRAVPDFVLQGGGVRTDGTQKTAGAPIANEARSSGLSNTRWTVAMARTADPDSATAEFFVNLDDNTFLDPDGSTPDGYAVFGKVVDGKPVVNTIVGLPASGEYLVEPVPFTDARAR